MVGKTVTHRDEFSLSMWCEDGEKKYSEEDFLEFT